MPVGAKMVVVFKASVEHGVSLALSHAIEFAFVVVPEAEVFHCSSPRPSSLGGSRQHSLARLDRSSYSRRARRKSTTEANYFLF
jgi:hypothetical protein